MVGGWDYEWEWNERKAADKALYHVTLGSPHRSRPFKGCRISVHITALWLRESSVQEFENWAMLLRLIRRGCNLTAHLF